MAVILYIDLLGARSRWKQGGIEASLRVFNHFTRSMIFAARSELAHISDGAIETDAAAFVCKDPGAAFRIARIAFRRAFDTPRRAIKERLWLRGAVVPSSGDPLRTQRSAHGRASTVQIFTYSHDFFDAVAIEKSGFKGMRLLVRGDLLGASLRRDLAFRVGTRQFVPFTRLKHSGYPGGATEDLRDFLWMASNEPSMSTHLEHAMSWRLRTSAADAEEFAQAAATQVLFHEAFAILRSVSRPPKVFRRRAG